MIRDPCRALILSEGAFRPGDPHRGGAAAPVVEVTMGTPSIFAALAPRLAVLTPCSAGPEEV